MVPEPLKEPRSTSFPEIPGYEIQAVIGRGATGVVYRARQLAVDREVAIKVLHAELAGRGKAVRRLQREARTTARLAHPNIVSAIDMGETRGLWWYAMELVDGPSLAERLHKEGRLDERDALKLFIPLCEALDHAFEHGVVHRDIKPANILIDSTGRARLVDLGLAFAEDDPMLTSPGGTLGTPHYVSPEQARNPQAADVRSDIWSLGATLYHAVCGRPPFGPASGAGGSVAEILSGVLYARVPDPGELEPSLSKGLQLVLRKCLSRDPERRYSTPRELLADLERIRERRQVRVQRGALDPVQREHDPRVAIAWTAGALALVLALVLGVWRPWRDAPNPGPAASAPSYYEPLELVAADAERGRKFLAKALNDLKRLQAEVPPQFEQRFKEVSADVHRRYNEAVLELRRSLHQELARLSAERDYVAATRLLDDDLEPRLRRELNPSPEQMRELDLSLEVAEKRRALEVDLDRAVKALGDQLSDHYWSFVLPRVESLETRGAWRSAKAELETSVTTRLAEAQISTRGLPEKRIEGLVASVGNLLVKPKTHALENRWKQKDAELERAVLASAADLELALRDRKAAPNAANELALRFDEQLRAEHVLPEEFLSEVSDEARATLARRGAELAKLESQLLADDAEQLYLEKVATLAPLWERRDYATLRREWQDALERSYMEPVRAKIELQREEAELLENLLVRAAERVSKIRPGDPPLRILVGTIAREGRVEPGLDPLNEGFRLFTKDASPTLWLALRDLDDDRAKKLGTDAIEALAELPAEPTDPLERLTRAVFRWREGDVHTAAALLPIVPLPRDDLAGLVADLGLRVEQAVSVKDVALRDREQAAEQLYNMINREARAKGAKPEATSRRVDELLGRYGDLPFVGERKTELLELKASLTQPPSSVTVRDLVQLFRASGVHLEGQRASLTFDFGSTDCGWSRGDWVVAGDGWQPPALRSRAQLLETDLWPALLLRPPLDLDREMEVELALQEPQDSLPKLLLVSIAGVHVALFSPPKAGRLGRWRVASGGDAELGRLVSEVLDSGEGEPFPGLARGANHRLRIELSQTRGSVSLLLDGQRLGTKPITRPDIDPATASLVVRALEPIRLDEARVVCRYH